MHKIVITGPESTGKTTLAKQLAAYFKVPFVKEYARNYLNSLGRPYQQKDLIKIVKGQIENENQAMSSSQPLVICDTSLEVIKIWSEYKYQTCNDFILKMLDERQPDVYLLMKPDIPWAPDPLRENKDDRLQLFNLYKSYLETAQIPYFEISGVGSTRVELAKSILEKQLV